LNTITADGKNTLLPLMERSVSGFFMALDNYSPQLRLVGFFDGHFSLCIVADINKDVKISLSIVAVDF
jgi:hypothetical protein